MNLHIRVESLEQTAQRARERAKKMDRGEHLTPERSLTFETIEDMMEILSRERIRLCVTAREEPRSVTALAEALGRNRRAVSRDVQRLAELGLLRLKKEMNPGHGQVTIVETTADRFDVRLKF